MADSGPAGAPSAALRRYLASAVPEATRRAYESDLRHFYAWGGAIPASPLVVAEYLAAYAGQLSCATLTRRLAAIAKVHRGRGLPSPAGSELVRTTLRGIRRVHGRPPSQVAPILLEDLAAMVSALGGGLRDLRDRALLLVGFAGAFRRSELAAINCSDLAWSAEGLIVTLPRSKTDQEGQGRQVAIPTVSGSLCPVSALEAWITAAGIAHGPVFRAVDRHGNVSRRALTPEAVARIVKVRAAAAGLDPHRYSGHSLRAGLVTSAAAAGVPPWAIKAQTGHTSDAMLSCYIRAGERAGQNAVQVFLTARRPTIPHFALLSRSDFDRCSDFPNRPHDRGPRASGPSPP